MDAVKQAIGPRQEAWLKALESGEYQQCKAVLTTGKAYCCLGVACKVMGMEIERTPGDYYLFGGEDICLPHAAVNHYAFRREVGDSSLIHEMDNAIPPQDKMPLTNLNDIQHLSFAEIAAKVRANPERYFTKAV